ncbi:MAG: M18 family aminopeptidase [Clostridia bacterium]|nr:M18 family aminopeptidase [Clostridia bacterium]
MNNNLLKFIEASPTAYHSVASIKAELSGCGFTELFEGKPWNIEKGKDYFVTRNGSSIVAFKVPLGDFSGFMISASHCDSPAFKIKENPELKDKFYVRLSTEKYGGMIDSTWLDRPLSIAGRVLVKTENGVSVRLVDFKEPSAIIPNVAIHLNRKINEGVAYNAALDLLPLFSLAESESFKSKVAVLAGVSEDDIVSTDLTLYNCEKGAVWNDFVSSPRLDDLQCVFASLVAFKNAEALNSIPVLAVFDSEEVGSRTRQGADSTFMSTVLRKLSLTLGLSEVSFSDKVANSMLLSCDNAHGVNPNHPEITDSNHQCVLNGGVVIKHNANQTYCTDGLSGALLKVLCDKAGVQCQHYYNRADILGGSTLGNIANTQLSMICADIGLAQLSMHSSFETAGKKDTETMVKLLKTFFSSSLKINSDNEYEI